MLPEQEGEECQRRDVQGLRTKFVLASTIIESPNVFDLYIRQMEILWDGLLAGGALAR